MFAAVGSRGRCELNRLVTILGPDGNAIGPPATGESRLALKSIWLVFDTRRRDLGANAA